MTLEKEDELRTNGNLFQEPDSTLLLSSGCGRHWPDARGIYHNNDANLFVWVNEEDQMRIVSMEKGDNVRGIIERFAKARFYNFFLFFHNDIIITSSLRLHHVIITLSSTYKS